MIAVLNGASVLRVHNVPYTRDLIDVVEALRLETAGDLPQEALQPSGGGGT
jgi:dihydropteroate synthase